MPTAAVFVSWLFLAPPGCFWLLLVALGFSWCCSWLVLADPGCSWLLLASPGAGARGSGTLFPVLELFGFACVGRLRVGRAAAPLFTTPVRRFSPQPQNLEPWHQKLEILFPIYNNSLCFRACAAASGDPTVIQRGCAEATRPRRFYPLKHANGCGGT